MTNTLENTIEPGRLPCGCSPGKPACAEAFHLLQRLDRLQLEARQAETWQRWTLFEAARATYNKHFDKR